MAAVHNGARLAWAATWLAAACGTLCAVVCAPSRARAYSSPEAYAEVAYQGGGEGRWFTGSPADGYGCGVCHAAAPGQREYPLYVQGLPAQQGYALGAQHQVVLSWPQFATRWSELRPNPALPPVMGAPLPGVGLSAELVAESGTGSGVIELGGPGTQPGEFCEQARPNLQPRLAAKLYQVRTGVAPFAVRPDASGVLRCEARLLGQRCILALSSCGARELRFRWTAPLSWQGPIWFSAGFVATEAITGTFEQDSVSEVSLALVQQGTAGGDYQQKLESGCAVAGAGVHRHASTRWGAVLAGALMLVLLVRMRRHTRIVRARIVRARMRALVLLLALLLAGTGCEQASEVKPSAYPTAGLYTPGSKLGVSDPSDVPAPSMGLGNRCVSLTPGSAAGVAAGAGAGAGAAGSPALAAGTRGKLTVMYRTQSLRGRYAPKNCSAVWIETADGRYVATLELSAALRRPGLVYFQDHACTARLGPDVMTSATKPNHDKAHMAVWNGADFESKPVADGAYKLFIEVTETDKDPGELSSFDFQKGPVAFANEAPVAFDGPLAQVTMSWELAP